MNTEKRQLHCWEDRGYWFAITFGWFSDEHIQAEYVDGGGTCMLERGHDGEHEWTSDSDIGISFAEHDGRH